MWLDKDVWDVEARGGPPTLIAGTDLRKMFQNLLADEFKLRFHEESKQGSLYALMVDKSGSKMKVNDGPGNFEIPIDGHRGGVAVGKRVSMEYLCYWLKRTVFLYATMSGR